VQAVFLYPMNALANDQLERLRRLLRGTRVELSFAMYTGIAIQLRKPSARSQPRMNGPLGRRFNGTLRTFCSRTTNSLNSCSFALKTGSCSRPACGTWYWMNYILTGAPWRPRLPA